MDNIHGELGAMTQAVSRSADVQSTFEDYQNKLRNISEMVQGMWHGQAQRAFNTKYMEIDAQLKAHSTDMGTISEGTSKSQNDYLHADESSAAVLNALSGN
jgi:WXG100 family type VII secretion target